MKLSSSLLVVALMTGCQPVEVNSLVLLPIPDSLDARPGCTGRSGVDTLVLDLLEVTVDEGAEPMSSARASGLCAACDQPGSGVHCALRQRVCTCVDPARPLTRAEEMNDALAGVTLDVRLPDALTCVRVFGLRRAETSSADADAWSCGELSLCALDARPAAGDDVTFCGVTDAIGPDTPPVPVAPELIACGALDSCPSIQVLCTDRRTRDDPRFADLCLDFDRLCGPGGGALGSVDDCLCAGGGC